MVKKIIKFVISGLIPLMLFTSCGNDSSLPAGGSITVNPSKIDWAVGLVPGCAFVYPGSDPELQIHRITTRDADGNPLGKVDLDLNMVLTENSSGFAVTWLLIDLDENGLFDGFDGTIASVLRSEELITQAGAGSIYSTETNEFGWLDVGILTDLGGCSYTGRLSINSGSVGALLEFKVAAS